MIKHLLLYAICINTEFCFLFMETLPTQSIEIEIRRLNANMNSNLHVTYICMITPFVCQITFADDCKITLPKPYIKKGPKILNVFFFIHSVP